MGRGGGQVGAADLRVEDPDAGGGLAIIEHKNAAGREAAMHDPLGVSVVDHLGDLADEGEPPGPVRLVKSATMPGRSVAPVAGSAVRSRRRKRACGPTAGGRGGLEPLGLEFDEEEAARRVDEEVDLVDGAVEGEEGEVGPIAIGLGAGEPLADVAAAIANPGDPTKVRGIPPRGQRRVSARGERTGRYGHYGPQSHRASRDAQPGKAREESHQSAKHTLSIKRRAGVTVPRRLADPL